jgi:FAD/FMN-containing dehydrogenase
MPHVGAGVNLRADAAARGLIFPLTLGARGLYLIGGFDRPMRAAQTLCAMAARGLCLGLEIVMADGRTMNLMTALRRKDNSGLDLRNLVIRAEGRWASSPQLSSACANDLRDAMVGRHLA